MARRGYGDDVGESCDVADAVVVVVEILEDVAVAFAGLEVAEAAVVGVVTIRGADVVAGFHEYALFEFVVFEARKQPRLVICL